MPGTIKSYANKFNMCAKQLNYVIGNFRVIRLKVFRILFTLAVLSVKKIQEPFFFTGYSFFCSDCVSAYVMVYISSRGFLAPTFS